MTYRLPSLNTLRAFEAAARHLSFKTAASELGVTAGAVSQQVKKLEASLGIPLFRRLPHGLLLTREAEVYLPAITKVFEDLTAATEAIAPEINGKKFRVGICPSIRTALPVQWPNHTDTLRHHIRECVETDDVAMIWADEIDCLIREAGGPYGDLAVATVPGRPDLHFVCRPGVLECRQSQAILYDLAEHAPALHTE